jgi:hypothetical protein
MVATVMMEFVTARVPLVEVDTPRDESIGES